MEHSVIKFLDDTAKIWNVAHLMKDPFNTTQELINAARESIPKGFTVKD